MSYNNYSQDSSMIDSFTSNGSKFWKHFYQMNNYKNNNPNTVISTHISPTSKCNLHCEYCSVKSRKQNNIKLEIIQDYVEKLITRGLKAVILTGGGEPTFYPDFNKLVQWLKYDKKLSVALITNGTNSNSIDDYSVFSWIRVSINIFENWQNKIFLPIEKIDNSTIIGMSYIDGDKQLENVIEDLKYLKNELKASYIRILPNCLLPKDELEKEHQRINDIFIKYNLNKYQFFHQYKNHEVQNLEICHQSFFRPYLSEVDGGTVYPCDSIVLNDQNRYFHKKYQICKATDILEFLDKKISLNFKPCNDCSGCVFSNNIQLLDNWINNKIDLFEEFKNKYIIHEDFV